MKKKIAFYALLGLVVVLSCSKDSDDSPPSNGNVDKTANLQVTGSSANDILSNTNFDKLVFEIVYVDGFRPTTTAITNFETFIRERTFKTDIEFSYRSLASPNEESLTTEEVDDIEQENRTAYNDGTTLAVYIYFADAPSDGDDLDEGLVTLGAVYRNTSMVIYESTIRDLASRSNIISVSDVESSTLNHEFAHLMGLVDLGTELVNDHEDPEAENHCNVSGCLMRAELQFGGPTMKLLEKNVSKGAAVIPVLDDECILDLQNNGGR
ncbi:hypothetical protein [Flagellimonas myxillae]|uniref:hypothetical protein n=1 Tax=Flagellimonas myxillae TaxID=2942214 RepID=UPI00201E88BC|nr:hypothetical protein [Muricauda myxillae]MCL6265023.1 hypothetical protein [Muricauda myxillae]